MPINGNALAKYLVMVSQVIAWCTVSAMLLRRGLNQVNASSQQPPSSSYGSKPYGGSVAVFGGSNTTSTAATDTGHHRQETPEKSFDENGAPAVVAGVVMIAIAVIMLIISPTIMVMKMIEKRNKRILDTVSIARRDKKTNLKLHQVSRCSEGYIIILVVCLLRI